MRSSLASNARFACTHTFDPVARKDRAQAVEPNGNHEGLCVGARRLPHRGVAGLVEDGPAARIATQTQAHRHTKGYTVRSLTTGDLGEGPSMGAPSSHFHHTASPHFHHIATPHHRHTHASIHKIPTRRRQIVIVEGNGGLGLRQWPRKDAVTH
jgi:hypothetical protein